MSPTWITPAWLSSTSNEPKVSTVARTMAWTSMAWVTSTSMGWTRVSGSNRLISLQARSAARPSWSASATVAPSRAKRIAVARPIPDPAPVTRHTLSCNRMLLSTPRPARRGRGPSLAHWAVAAAGQEGPHLRQCGGALPVAAHAQDVSRHHVAPARRLRGLLAEQPRADEAGVEAVAGADGVHDLVHAEGGHLRLAVRGGDQRAAPALLHYQHGHAQLERPRHGHLLVLRVHEQAQLLVAGQHHIGLAQHRQEHLACPFQRP